MNKIKLMFSLAALMLSLGLTSKAQKTLTAYEAQQYEGLKNDWPNLNRYRAENEKLGLPAVGEKRVVFMGNSITEGWSAEHPEFFTGKPYINRGISGQTTPQMLVRFRQDVLALKPEAVVILAGINDIAGNTGPSTLEMIEGNIASMAEVATANRVRVILCSVLPAHDFPWNPGVYPAKKIVELNRWLKQYADDHHYGYVDYHTSMADDRGGLKEAYSEDGVHPNRQGYEVMEPLVERVIREILTRQ